VGDLGVVSRFRRLLVGGALLVLLTMQAPPVVPLPPRAEAPAEAPVAPPRAAPVEPVPAPPPPRIAHPYLRTAVEEFLILGAGAAWYWRHPAQNSGDLTFTWGDWESKLFSTNELGFDNDLFSTNGIAHPVAGALYYQVARGNGLSPLASLVTTIMVSTSWEYLAEWDEKPSTNDLILTPAAGAVIGEATYRLGRMFAAGAPSLGNCLGALIFSPVATLNRTPVCREGNRQPTDDFGLPARTWHRIVFAAGQAYASFDGGPVRTAMDLGVAADVVDHDRYLQPGEGLSAITPGEWTAFSVGALINHVGLRGLEIHAEGVWWGRYFRDYAPTDEAAPRQTDGWGLMLGLGSMFDFDARDLGFDWDRVVTAGLVGPKLEYTSRHGDLTARASLIAEYGFSMVTSLAYQAAAPSLSNEIVRSALQERGYYYAQSVTGVAALSLEDEPMSLYLRVRLGGFWSIDQGDHFQSELTQNFPLHDRRAYLRAAGTIRVLGGPLRLILAFDQINRNSQLATFSYDGVERRLSLSVLAVF
jgi:hypothetical protein